MMFSLCVVLLSWMLPVCGIHMDYKQYPVHEHAQHVQLHFTLQPDELVYAQHLHISSDNPHITVKKITHKPEATQVYSQEFGTQKKAWNTDFVTDIEVVGAQHVSGHLHVVYRVNSKHVQQQVSIPVHFAGAQPKNIEKRVHAQPEKAESVSSVPYKKKQSWKQKLEDFFEHTSDPKLLIIFAFLMGLLASLTPCIYPMIPLTIGVLHHKGGSKKSVGYNFLVALCYAFGIACTFALIGLGTAFIGGQLGSLLAKPWFVALFVAVLGYLALSMMGLVHMNMPSFLQTSGSMQSNMGPCMSAFLFGAMSGPVASPCVSPALLLLLGKVAAFGSYVIGFGMLFAFGFGLSALLVLAGTFSSSLTMLPQSGQWMEDIKKFIGIMMLGMCVFYVANIASPVVVAGLWVAYAWVSALFLVWDAWNVRSGFMRIVKVVAAAIAIMLGLQWAMQMHTHFFVKQKVVQKEHGVLWMTDISQAQQQAQSEGKLLVYDFYGKACSMCKAIDRKIFSKDSVYTDLQDDVVFLKVDGNTQQAYPYLDKFAIRGFPTIVVESSQGVVVKQWASDLYSYTPEQFIDEIKALRS